jgi:hypothetical protein
MFPRSRGVADVGPLYHLSHAVNAAADNRQPVNVRREAERLIREHPEWGMSADVVAERLAQIAVDRLVPVEMA